MNCFKTATNESLSPDEIREALLESLEGRSLNNVLIVVPDFTRMHSNAGYITNTYYHVLQERNIHVDILFAVGSHAAVTPEQAAAMYGDIPFECFIPHNWRTDCMKLGEVPASYIEEITGGLWNESIAIEINRLVMDERYDLIISVGQVVPHEIVGMSNHAKNLFVGVGGSDMINTSHMMGTVYGMERVIGRDHTPVRKVLDYGMEHFLNNRPILFVLTVCTAPGGNIKTHGLFIGEDRTGFNHAVKLAQEKNITFVEKALKKCVVYLDPTEFKSTWVGNKSVDRTRMAIADGGELIILGGGVKHFSEDSIMDGVIRKYGYRGKESIMKFFHDPKNEDLRANMGAPAHLIHGSSDNRFSITYAVRSEFQGEVAAVGYIAADYDQMIAKYDPRKLKYGYNIVDNEEIFFIPNPAIGLWMTREAFEAAE